MKKLTYYRRRDEGLCVRCGQPLPALWKNVSCATCLQVKETHPRTVKREQVITQTSRTLDQMAKEAHKRGISYGQLQTEETVERIRYADRSNMTLKRWGRQVMFG